MQPIETTPPRYTVEQQWDTTVITTLPRRHWWTVTKIVVGMPFWLVWGGFAVILLSAMMFAIFDSVTESVACLNIAAQILSGLVALFLLLSWAFYGLAEVGWLLWQLAGKEVISLGPEIITVRLQLLFFSYTGEYLAEHIRSLRIKQYQHQHTFGKHFKRRITFHLATFDYQDKAIHFGFNTTLDENKQILRLIGEHYPQHRHLQTFRPEPIRPATSNEVVIVNMAVWQQIWALVWPVFFLGGWLAAIAPLILIANKNLLLIWLLVGVMAFGGLVLWQQSNRRSS